MMKWAKGFVAKEGVLVGVDVSEVALLTRNEVGELVFGVRRIEYESTKVESQSEEGWDF